eukprot:TRINITY_DN3659_c0_g1_i1.p1 TRINITY_DN3659_c0_g1~~TRINITY_DN3659_c0_g1_i1.p1  ORF type:complete len:605 (+),score=162.91 TRINITY_DN3659_c0_g1_i1:229-1815(+)
MAPTKLLDLYEHIALELAEMHERETAKSMLKQTQPLLLMRERDPERYAHLEHVIHAPYFDTKEAYGATGTKERRRNEVARALAAEVQVVPPSRLLALIGQALKWQHLQGVLPPGAKLDLFRGSISTFKREDETFPKQLERTIKFGSKTHAECAKFSPDGQYLITGSVDGFIEVWDFYTGKINTQLKYQADEEFMMHADTSVLCMTCSKDAEAIATGSQDGLIKVWQLRSGKCLRRFENAHEKGVSCVCFSRDGQQLLSGSHDTTLRIHGLKSGRTLKIFRGHMSFVNDCIFSHTGGWVLSASSDGSIRVWDAHTADCLSTFYPSHTAAGNPLTSQPATGAALASVVALCLNPANPEQQFFVATSAPAVYLMSSKGAILRTFSPANAAAAVTAAAPTSTTSSAQSSIGAAAASAATTEVGATVLENQRQHQREMRETLARDSGQSAMGEDAAAACSASVTTCLSVSPRGQWLYCGTATGQVRCFSVSTGRMEHLLNAHDSRCVLGTTLHPHVNLMASFSEDGTLKLWRP